MKAIYKKEFMDNVGYLEMASLFIRQQIHSQDRLL